MAHAHYRGKLSTSKEIKGVFTEANDDFSVAFEILAASLTPGTEVKIFARPLAPAGIEEILFSINGMYIIINREGLIEVGEGTAQ